MRPARPALRYANGVSSFWAYVTECNKRDAQHFHGKNGGALNGDFLADIAAFPTLRAAASAALDTQLTAEMPIEYHAARVLQKAELGKAALRYSAFSFDEWSDEQKQLISAGQLNEVPDCHSPLLHLAAAPG